MVLFTCTALRFKQPTTISFASLTSLSRERRRQKKLSPGKKATQNRLDWVLGTTRFARGGGVWNASVATRRQQRMRILRERSA